MTLLICHFVRSSRQRCFCSLVGSRQKPQKADLNAYKSNLVEAEWHQWWDSINKVPRSEATQYEVICFPPPNVTGDLHIGHALTVAIEDSYVRWKRMSGDRVLWVPGFDHAGIATQLAVEKWLASEQKIVRSELTREAFIDYCNEWKDKRCSAITHQLNRLGASLDWSSCYYTMDKRFSEAVTYAFRTLYDQKLVFTDQRLVYWSPYLKSTLSDVEIDNVKLNEPKELLLPGHDRTCEFGWLYYVNYDVVDAVENQSNKPGCNCVTVATTRPETIPADCALAVNPNDSRYSNLIGKRCRNPLVPDSVIPIIADEKVDPDLGSGILKLTPGHDKVDFEIVSRHSDMLNASPVNLFTDDGRVVSSCPFADIKGKSRFEARRFVVDYLSQIGKLSMKVPHPTTVPICSKTGDVVESMPKKQWFLDCKPMAQRVLNLIDDGQLNFYPGFQKSVLKHWLQRTEDWCLSRQLCWGHRIPVYTVEISSQGSSYSEHIVANDKNEAIQMAENKYGKRALSVEQDADVFDTWFSSALVPLVVCGWPNSKVSFDDSKPLLNLMETGHDILSFWISRMLMLGLHFTDKLPFKDILLHGIVRDAQGRKMSKSLGNVIDPLDVIDGKSFDDLCRRINQSNLGDDEKANSAQSVKANFPQGIPMCGADALRFSLLSNDVKSYTINMDVKKVENRSHFCNKIWQGFRYMKKVWRDDLYEPISSKNDKDFKSLTPEDLWLLSRLSYLTSTVEKSMKTFDFHYATHCLFMFWWHELCDIYLEYSKPFVWNADQATSEENSRLHVMSRLLVTVSDVFLRLAAPFMPFVTEELYCLLPLHAQKNKAESIHSCSFPTSRQVNFLRPEIDVAVEKVVEIASKVRAVKKEFGIPYNHLVSGYLICDEITSQSIGLFEQTFKNLSKFDFLLRSNRDFVANAENYVFYLVNRDCQICLKLNDSERFDAVRTVETQMIKKRKQLSFCKQRLEKVSKFKKCDANLQQNISRDIVEAESEVQRLEELCKIVRRQ